MPENKKDARVLSRLGARELCPAEYDHVGGGFIIHTKPCTLDPITCIMDGDCEQSPC